MKAFYILSVIFVIIVSAIIAEHDNVATASYIIQVEIVAILVLLQTKPKKEDEI